MSVVVIHSVLLTKEIDAYRFVGTACDVSYTLCTTKADSDGKALH
jgi:hypothetical protein